MNLKKPLDSSHKIPLGLVLHRGNMRMALIALGLAGVSIFFVGLIALRAYMLDNLILSAKTVAYGVEAAVVFNDREAVMESMKQMIASRPIASASVLDRDGDELAHWQRPETGGWVKFEQILARALLIESATARIQQNGHAVGTVKLYGSGRDLLVYLAISIGCGLTCLVLSGLVASRYSRQASQEIIEHLRHLASVAAKARREQQFQYRVKPTAIAELHEFGDDFNALLEELERWHTQILSHNELLAHRANHDPLTGLANRALFESRLAAELLAARAGGGHLALFFIDVDRFKVINDELGHEVGDSVLCAIACRLRSKVRESDLVARIGGDEFAVLLTPMGNFSQAGRIAGNMLDSMVEPIELPAGEPLTTSLSIGIAFYPDHAIDATGLLKKADEAMYQSKRSGRGVYSVAANTVSAVVREEP